MTIVNFTFQSTYVSALKWFISHHLKEFLQSQLWQCHYFGCFLSDENFEVAKKFLTMTVQHLTSDNGVVWQTFIGCFGKDNSVLNELLVKKSLVKWVEVLQLYLNKIKNCRNTLFKTFNTKMKKSFWKLQALIFRKWLLDSTVKALFDVYVLILS